MRALSKIRPLLPGYRDYAQVPRTWKGDLVAGLTVGIVALPLALAFGVSSAHRSALLSALVLRRGRLPPRIVEGRSVENGGPRFLLRRRRSRSRRASRRLLRKERRETLDADRQRIVAPQHGSE